MKMNWCGPCREAINRYQRAYAQVQKGKRRKTGVGKRLCKACARLSYLRYTKPYRTRKVKSYRKYQRDYRRKYRAEGRDRWMRERKRRAA